jgi:PadR family transcriptional regulator, regulatory protein PadR
MGKGDYLGEFEQLVLLSVLRLGAGAYGMPVRQEIEERARRDVSIGAVYATLERLQDKGLVASTLGEPSAERGGRAKRTFEVTTKGISALKESQRCVKRMLDGISLPALRTPGAS